MAVVCCISCPPTKRIIKQQARVKPIKRIAIHARQTGINLASGGARPAQNSGIAHSRADFEGMWVSTRLHRDAGMVSSFDGKQRDQFGTSEPANVVVNGPDANTLPRTRMAA